MGGIRLDWEVESDGGSEAVAEDAAALAAMQRRRAITRRMVIATILIGLVVVGGLALRVRQVRAQMLEALTATVEAETLALRLGDEAKFMRFQAASEEWRNQQHRSFEIFQNANPGATVTDEILDLQITGDEARVTIRVILGNTETSAIWLYAYSTEKGWRHVGTEQEPWARQVIDGGGYSIEYPITDEVLALETNELISSWWHTAYALTGMAEPLEVTIVIDPYATSMQWTDPAETRLALPSLTADGAPITQFDSEQFQRFAQLLGDRWTRYVLDDRAFAPDDAWMHSEVQMWMRNLLDPAADDPPVLSLLAGAFGHDMLLRLFLELRTTPDLSASDALMNAMALSSPSLNQRRGALDRYLEEMLRAELMYQRVWKDVISNSDNGLPSELFWEGRGTGMSIVQFALYDPSLDPQTIRVTDIHTFGEITWARIQFSIYREAWPGAETQEREVVAYAPFIERDGYLVHTWPRESDWGEKFLRRSSGALASLNTLTLYELDASRTSAGLINEISALFFMIFRDFGIEAPPRLEVTISPELPAPDALIHIPDPNPEVMNLVIPSMYAGWGGSFEGDNYYYHQIGSELVQAVFNSKAAGVPVPPNYISRAISEYEMDRLGIRYDAWIMPGFVPADAYIPTSLDGIWVVDHGRGGQAEFVEHTAKYLGSKVLINLIIEWYGIERLPALIENLDGSYTVSEWLFASLGVHASDLEAEWYRRYLDVLIAHNLV